MQLSAADSRKKKRRRRRELPLPAACSSRSAAGGGAAQGQCQCQCCCCSSPGGSGLVATTIPCAFSRCSGGASSSAACAPVAAAVRLGTQQHKLTMLLVALALLLVLPPAPFLVAGVSVSPRRMARIQSHLDRINKTPVRSIRSADGDTIDCVAAHEQHGLDHPLLRTHSVQTEPPEAPMPRGGGGGFVVPAAAGCGAATAGNGSSSGKNNRRRGAWQTWHHGGHCPRGTVAIRRTTAEDVLRARSISRFGRKRRHRNAAVAARAANAPDVITGNGHEHAIAYTSPSQQQVYGAKATINVWDPAIQESNGFSLSQLWILSGSFNGSDLNSIEAGWQSDAYEATGCYNALCPGFVQTSPRIAIGASISPVSSAGGAQYDMTLLIWKDPKLGNWWLSYGDQLVGYWPAQLFTHLSDHATMVEWGGEVVDTRPGGVHTATQMGSGRFAGEGFGRASYFRNLETVDADNSLAEVALDAIQTLAENPACYDIRKAYDDDGQHSARGGWGTHFYYGGPGQNLACP
ncbi:protein neprosin-like isoform X2 [Miscanthus floridulus]|uniref:protein neprosin-like isoform X2 n=1 Tax=Miscanthus floridulus TaxID=154761 RepID=UPI0034587BD0